MLAQNEESFASVITVACYSIFYFPPTHSSSPLSLCLSLSLSTRFLLLACCLCVALSLYLCVTRIRKKHHAPQSHQLRGNTSLAPSASLTHLQSQSPSHSLFHSHSPFPSRSHFQFPLSWSFSIWYARPIFDHLKRVFVFVIVFFRSVYACTFVWVCLYLYLSCFVVVVVVIVVLARCACRRQFIAFLLWFCVNFSDSSRVRGPQESLLSKLVLLVYRAKCAYLRLCVSVCECV